MVKLDRICFYIFLFCLVGLLPSAALFKFVDEICYALLLLVAVLDCIANKRWKAYIPLFCVIGILLFYVCYSLTLNNNTLPYILVDFIIQLKPFAPFLVLTVIRPQFTIKELNAIKWVSIINCFLAVLLLILRYVINYKIVVALVQHEMYLYLAIIIGALSWIYCSAMTKGKLKNRDKQIIVTMLVAGLLCIKSRYFGEVVLFLFFLYIYKPGMFKSVNSKPIIGIGLLFALVLAVSWKKISYYFIQGIDVSGGDIFSSQSFARPVLYATSWLILLDYFPFGSGLASFATYASQSNYSNLYFEYGLNNVFGLSPETPEFICDAFFPELAQFGFVGIILFITYWCWIYKKLKRLPKETQEASKWLYVIGIMCICIALIESVAATTFVQCPGLVLSMLLALACNGCTPIRKETTQEELAVDLHGLANNNNTTIKALNYGK